MSRGQVQDVVTEEMAATIHRPETTSVAACVLAHGAGSDRHADLLVRLATELAAGGVTAARIDLPYRRRRPKGPPSPSGAAEDRSGIGAACRAVAALCPTPTLLVGGHSYGGRQASMALADDPGLADGLLLTSYPLHPPRRPDRMRTDHLPRITRPVVLVHGSSDPFATSEELADAVALIAAPTLVVEIAGAGHDLRPDRKPTARLTADAVRTHLLGRGDG